jgi:hypothetical protein
MVIYMSTYGKDSDLLPRHEAIEKYGRYFKHPGNMTAYVYDIRDVGPLKEDF